MILGTGVATIANAELITVPFGTTYGAAPSIVFVVFLMPSGTTVIDGDIVAGSITTTQFQVQLRAAPGDALHQIGWIAFQ